jgi:hypothetical protein
MTKVVNTKREGGISLTDLGSDIQFVSLKCTYPICPKTNKFRSYLLLG